ncbi:Sugar ABC transporter, permease protein [Streptococcus macedonicus ACA-DC 198]|uniref:Sugar ABC transporter permease n=1 Tax=Streptococcus gallolyticus TaxID=315405 RepID=A0A380K2E1_9STRE|nr:Sugar ABC transporter, permease protein [Streptococcus macedonicus ACA-DC 198]SUN59221.1 Sugar ABC transporter permease [Streptococcus gallolyticus]
MTKSKLSKEWEKRILVFSFTIIPVLLLLVFSYYPLIKMIQYSLTDWNGYGQNPNFVGLDNYKTVLTNPKYFSVFKTSLYYFIATFFQLGIALLFATILSFKVKFANFWKGILFFPYLLNGVAIGFIFLYFYKGGGTLDTVLKAIGLGDQIRLWLGDRSINYISLAFTSVWCYTGFNFLVFLGTIQSINPEVYEAAEIDGANRWDQFRYIIIPSIRNIVFLNIILGVSGSLSVFDIPYIMTGGSNETSTFVIQTIIQPSSTIKLVWHRLWQSFSCLSLLLFL